MAMTSTASKSPDQGQPTGTIGYAQALSELEGILDRLERADVDVDVLAGEVKRATELIALCRQRIGAARLQIEQAVADLDDANDTNGDDR